MLAVEPYHLSLCDALYAACESDKGRISLKTTLKDLLLFDTKKKTQTNRFLSLLREEGMKILE